MKVYFLESEVIKDNIKSTSKYSYLEYGMDRYIHDMGYNIFLHSRYLNILNDYKKCRKPFLEFKKFLDTL
jgi:hypothetical protein